MLLKMMLLKKAVYDKLAAKVNNIDTSYFVLKTKYQTDKAEIKKDNSWCNWFCKKNKTHWIRKQKSRYE